MLTIFEVREYKEVKLNFHEPKGVCNGTNSTCIGCDNVLYSGKVLDACGVCDGDGSTCTEIVEVIPSAIASEHPSVLVIGAGLDDGDETVCVLYNTTNGDMVTNTTGKCGKSLTTIK